MQKNLSPEPVKIATSIVGVSRTMRNASSNSRAVWNLSLLACSGRLIAIVATPLSTVTTMS